MTDAKPLLAVLFAPLLSLGACQQSADPAASPVDGDPAATRPSGSPALLTLEGRIESGVECRVLHTPGGKRYAFNGGDDFATGAYVRITGELADASFCQEGEGTLIIDSIERAEAPARDRDPARAGGIAVTSEYVRGSWVAKGAGADCDRPDFQVTANRRGGNIIETRVNGVPTTGYVDVGDQPALRWDQGLADMPIETRGPDGLAILPGEGPTATLAGVRIEGDGAVFVKCA